MGKWGLLSLLAVVACRPQHAATNLAEAASGEERLGIGLDEFDYEPKDTLLAHLGRRIGCEAAAQLIVRQRSGKLAATLADVGANARVPDGGDGTYYDAMRAALFDREATRQACAGLAQGQVSDELAGLKRLLGPDEGLTFVMIGGFGSHTTPLGALEDSRRLWSAHARTLADPSRLRVWRIECTNSYSPDETCAKEVLDRIARKEQEEPSSAKHRYVIWGYSKGGNTGLHALMESRDLRNKTIALITAGSPLGGGLPMLAVVPALEAAVKARDRLFSAEQLQLFYAVPALMPFAAPEGDAAVRAEYVRLFTEKLDETKAGAVSISPVVRRRFLLDKLKASDFGRDGGKPVRVFHLAGVLDVAELRPLPAITAKDGALAPVPGSSNSEHFGELAMLPLYRDFPLSDSCVALQHAVIPRRAVPAGVSTELIGLLSFDHASFRLTKPTNGDRVDVPGVAFVDAVLETVADRLAE